MSSPTSRSSAVANPVAALHPYGQSVWLDFIRRSLIASGELARMVEDDALGGMTSNPAIFEKAIDGSDDYRTAIDELSRDEPGLSAKAVYERLAIKDIQDAADVLRPVYDRTKAHDGYVSLEVSPDLANDTAGTLAEAHHLWKTVNRPNVMIKVPGDPRGRPRHQGADRRRHQRQRDPALRALGLRGGGARLHRRPRGPRGQGPAPRSRGQRGQLLREPDRQRGRHPPRREAQDRLRSRQGPARGAPGPGRDRQRQARLPELQGDLRRSALPGARGEGSADPARALGQHRHQEPEVPRRALHRGADRARDREHGPSRDPRRVSRPRRCRGPASRKTCPRPPRLLARPREGRSLADQGHRRPSRRRAQEVRRALHEAPEGGGAPQPRGQPGPHQRADARLARGPRRRRRRLASRTGTAQGGTRRLFAGDASLWSGQDEASWIGWLGIVEAQLDELATLVALRDEVQKEGFTHAVLLGMGGSSLCPEVWKETFGRVAGFPELLVLDSTDPAQVKAVEEKVDLAKTLFIVSSKSGSTLEPNIFKAYFFDRVKQVLGADKAGRRFVAVTDPGSNLEKEAKADGFRHVFSGLKSIGGRYSALSNFGMVPAAVMGLDVEQLLDEAERMLHGLRARACPRTRTRASCSAPSSASPRTAGNRQADPRGLARAPRPRRLARAAHRRVHGQGRQGHHPRRPRAPRAPAVYGEDRLFAYLRLEAAPDAAQDAAVEALEKAGQPVVRIRVATTYDIAEEFLRWEIATAIAGSVIGINPFNQPDVEASKIATKALTAEYEKTGTLPAETPFFDRRRREALRRRRRTPTALQKAAGAAPSLGAYLKAHLDRVAAGRLLRAARVRPDDQQRTKRRCRSLATSCATRRRWRRASASVRGSCTRPARATRAARTAGSSSRSPATTRRTSRCPGKPYTFGIVKAAQARGDFQVLAERRPSGPARAPRARRRRGPGDARRRPRKSTGLSRRVRSSAAPEPSPGSGLRLPQP